MKTDETFEEWFNKWVLNRWKEQGVVLLEDALERAGESAMDCSAEAAWNHQQKKVDELEKKVTELSWDGALNRAEEKIQDLEGKLAEAVELVEEANDIFDGIREGSYVVDSFTSQPYRLFLKALAQLSEKGEGDD